MSKIQTAPVAGFTPGERDYIRRELDMIFSTLPTVAEGFQLKTWRGGPEAGRPKLSPIARGLLERGLMRLDTSQHPPRLFFTEAGLAELHTLIMDRRFADPKKICPYPPGARHRSHTEYGGAAAAGIGEIGALAGRWPLPFRGPST
jgi:hypothetical protein